MLKWTRKNQRTCRTREESSEPIQNELWGQTPLLMREASVQKLKAQGYDAFMLLRGSRYALLT